MRSAWPFRRLRGNSNRVQPWTLSPSTEAQRLESRSRRAQESQTLLKFMQHANDLNPLCRQLSSEEVMPADFPDKGTTASN